MTGIAQPEVPQVVCREALIFAGFACTGVPQFIEDKQSPLVEVQERFSGGT